MKIEVSSTTQLVNVNGIESRIWEGYTDSGIKIYCIVPKIFISKDESRKTEFEDELQDHGMPSPELTMCLFRTINN